VTADRPVEVVPDADALAEAAARRFAAAAESAIRARGRFVVALSGGNTPRGAYQRLAQGRSGLTVAWPQVQVCWGDERCVPPDHAESDYRMARETLLDHVGIPPANVHRIRGEDDPAAAARAYEAVLRALCETPAGPPRAVPGASFDLVLLGLGPEGHTASLFPASGALTEGSRWVMAEYGGTDPRVWRITLTPPVINAAGEVLFLVSGRAKAAILRRVLEGPRLPRELPAQAIAPSRGRLRWLVDQAAAAELGVGAS